MTSVGGGTRQSASSSRRDTFATQIWAIDVSSFAAECKGQVSTSADLADELLYDFNERQKVKKFMREIDRIRSLAGKLLIRKVLCHTFPQHRWAEYKFATTREGRPYLVSPQLPVDFNITHDGDWVALIAAPATRLAEQPPCAPSTVGLDVMEIHLPHFEESVPDFVNTMDMTLTSKERAWIMFGNGRDSLAATPIADKDACEHPFASLNSISGSKKSPLIDSRDSARLKRLYILWTHKEALTKACGMGLGFDFSTLELPVWDWRHSASKIELIETTSAVHDGSQFKEYFFLAIVLPPGQLSNASRKEIHSKHSFPGTGGPSLLVAAMPHRLQQDLPLDTTSALPHLSSTKAQEAGILSILSMNELIKEARALTSA